MTVPSSNDDNLQGWQSPALPSRALMGRRVRLVPVDPIPHAQDLFDQSHLGGDSALWDYLFDGPFENEEQFRGYLWQLSHSATDVFYTILDVESELPVGIASYLRIVPAHGVIEIGHIWFAPRLQRTAGATEAIYLLASHVFDGLGYRRLEWKCDALNTRSRRAALRFGFSFEGIFRQHMVIKGRNRDTAWFAITDDDWPIIREAFEIWLGDDNFDNDGRQVRTLKSVRGTVKRLDPTLVAYPRPRSKLHVQDPK